MARSKLAIAKIIHMKMQFYRNDSNEQVSKGLGIKHS